MKLYATISSERASKGQGGNEFIHVHFKGEQDKGSGQAPYLGYVRLELVKNVSGEFYQLTYIRSHGVYPQALLLEIVDKKGNKQKTTNEWNCKNGHKNFTEDCKHCANNIPF